MGYVHTSQLKLIPPLVMYLEQSLIKKRFSPGANGMVILMRGIFF
jgi:hypothetical protein